MAREDVEKTCRAARSRATFARVRQAFGAIRRAAAAHLAALFVVLLGPASNASATPSEVPALALRLDCPTRAGKGRVVCALDVEARKGKVLRWADALIVSSPDFAAPLRSRIAATLPEEGASKATISIPLFAREENTGVMRVKARAVVCDEAARDTCEPESREIEASVAVTREAESRPSPKVQ